MTRKRILFIDGDESFSREMVAVAAAKGFDAVSTASSAEGVELARTDRPDLIFVSVELAPTNGWSVCTKLKKDDDLKDIPVVLTSSTSTSETFEKHKKLKTRADEYLLKPYSSGDLIRVAGELVGLPELEEALPADEDLVVEDESLSLGEFDTTTDEAISVDGDEPLEGLAGGEEELSADGLDEGLGADLEATPFEEGASSEDALDALGGSGEEELNLGDDLDPLAAVGPEEEISTDDDVVAPPQSDGLDDLAAFDKSFESLSGTGPSALGEEPAGEEQPFEASFDAAEAPLEDPLSLDETPIEEAPSEFGSEEFDTAAHVVDSGSDERVASLEARVAELEAEIEGFRAADGDHDAQLEKLRADASRKDKSVAELRAQLMERDREIGELRDAETKLSGEAAKAKAEMVRKEATAKAIAAKGEQNALLVKKLEKELAAAREEAKGGAALKAKLVELEAIRKTADESALELESLKEQLETANKDLAEARDALVSTQGELETLKAEAESAKADLESARADGEVAKTELESAKLELETARAEAETAKAELDTARSDANGLRTDLEEAQKTAERALANAVALQEKLADADSRVTASEASAKEAESKLRSVRDSLMKAIEEHLN